ncbi:TVP38/TMEM64 family protein [Antarcticibacterium flavum]|uniref:TVP38/TMEM64 family membrane protein n=1 Tax=Antarcticibacterium flavum TaxID=2058175 RepID=A0A5B7X0M6_9FLAO|nr:MULTISPECIES: TVP38/TMEM64 family protein [Antarcticibacterium]MCM4158955.1 TVP38/TMEM64 family protein [Antarcticibacterium sp. W02-3]QCY68208.1 TVP38/TMEM64 family protein [Antarcticibacterium flavum]
MEEKIESASVKKSKAPLYISLTILVLILASYFFIPQVKDFIDEAWAALSSGDEQRIEQWVSQFGYIGPLVIILAMILQMFLLIIPTIALMVVSILAYGPLWGSLIVFAAVYCASTVGYLIGAYLGPVIVEKLIGAKTEKKIGQFIEDYGFWAIIITRLNPLLSNDAISFVAGLLRMGYWRFIGATLVGIAPLTIFIAIMGRSNDTLIQGLVWGSVVSLILFIGYVWWDKKARKQKRQA